MSPFYGPLYQLKTDALPQIVPRLIQLGSLTHRHLALYLFSHNYMYNYTYKPSTELYIKYTSRIYLNLSDQLEFSRETPR